jgi:hypothetical protein
MTSCGDPAPGLIDPDPDVRADAGGWISGPGLGVPGDEPGSVPDEQASAPQDTGRATLAR